MADSKGAAAFISDSATLTGVDIRRCTSLLLANTGSRAFGARSGRRAGAGGVPTISGTTVSIPAGAAVVDAGGGAVDSAFVVSWGANVPTLAGTPADSSQPRTDVVYVRVDEVLGNPTTQTITFGYQAGVASSSPNPPGTVGSDSLSTSRVAILGYINVPASGGGAATVTPGLPSLASGGILPVGSSLEYPSAPYRGQATHHPAHGLVIFDGSSFTDPDPRGEIGYVQNPANLDVTSQAQACTITVPVVGGRRYKATAYVQGDQITAAGTNARAWLTGPWDDKYLFYDQQPQMGWKSAGTAFGRWSVGTSGTLTFTLQIGDLGAGALRVQPGWASILVEDLGQG